jgi:hypothetical protein
LELFEISIEKLSLPKSCHRKSLPNYQSAPGAHKTKTTNNHNVFSASQFQYQINVLKALKINLFFSNKKLMAF